MEFNICKPGKSGWRKVVAHCADEIVIEILFCK